MKNTAREICRRYQYKEIRTPIFEHTELFLRGVGDTTDIVQKEMYTFQDRGGRDINSYVQKAQRQWFVRISKIKCLEIQRNQ